MSIELKHFNDATVTPKDDAILYDLIVAEGGIISGCVVTHLGANQLQVAAGRGLIKGRQFVITQETINATVSDSGTKRGRLVVQIDTSNSTTPISFITQMASELPELTQEDINDDGNIYELPLVEYDISEVAISNMEDVSNQIEHVMHISYDPEDGVLWLHIPGCEVVQLCPITFNSTSQPSGTFPKGTLYLKHEP